jgi:hypothetical protein
LKPACGFRGPLLIPHLFGLTIISAHLSFASVKQHLGFPGTALWTVTYWIACIRYAASMQIQGNSS